MRKLTALVIAPELPDYPLPRMNIEIAAIARWMEATVLRGEVRSNDIAEAVADRNYDIIWYVGHGTGDGIMLSDGLLPIAGLVQYVRIGESGLCVLNTCESEDAGIDISSQSGADVICTIARVDNQDAVRLGQLLAGELANTNSYGEAFNIVATPGSKYRYYEAGKVDRSHRRDEDELLRLVYSLEVEVKFLRWLSITTLAATVLTFVFK